MTNFRKLDTEENDRVWDRFNKLFLFKPSVNNNFFFPAIRTGKPTLKFGVKQCFSPISMTALEGFAIDLFNRILSPGERLYALDWQHEGYDFDPSREMDRNEFHEWVVPVLPNGDYYIFLTKDFKNIWFGHPWQQTITLIGENIVNEGRKMKAPC